MILATVSINAVVGDNGIIGKAKKAKEWYNNGVIAEEAAMNSLMEEYENMMAEPPPTGPNGKQLVSSITTTEHNTITGEDSKGNQVVIPGGFKIAEDSGTTVQQGIVVEDASGNQFVWIPVSNINHDGSNLIKLDDDSTVEITLGRYTFDTSTGAETKAQYGSDYASTVTISSYYQELTTFRESNESSGTDGTNSTAKDLAGFINSVSTNKGYYLARYEASYASGSTFGVGNDSTYYKPASKVSTANRTSSGTVLTTGMLLNYITQGNASKASRQMYYGDEFVESDLCNSYAWDTAIVYIQAMGNSNYANAYDGNGTLKNTGATGDEKCKIFDMAANTKEWTTEYSAYSDSNGARPCTYRGGGYNSSYDFTSGRGNNGATIRGDRFSFRPLLYCKTGA